ncbi:MAG: formate--tetrahydrofolate ligase, partial [Bacteroidales bacterium]|nr:formate--tetrahydrofolate ligase [Bacteroidales bacterium]
NSVIATQTAMSLTDYTVTEAGFGFDLGAEKFLDIKCRSADISPDAAVLVATIRALKYHGGQPLKEITLANVETLKKGLPNLEKHIENIKQFALAPIVAINKFQTDSEEELDFLLNYCKDRNVPVAVIDVWAKGGAGAENLAQIVADTVDKNTTSFVPLYPLTDSVEKKIETISKKIYGAEAVDYTSKAKANLTKIANLGLDHLAICMAKTQKSLSDNPDLLGRPKDFVITVREIEVASGAGFLVPITGDIMRMPGLPEEPASEKMDIDNKGIITGVS